MHCDLSQQVWVEPSH